MKSIFLILSTIILSGCIGFTGADDGRLIQGELFIDGDLIKAKQ